MKNGQNLENGFTLVELMVAMVIGLITLGAALALYLTIFTGSVTTIRSVRLNHDIDSAISLISNELRRAGYNGNAQTGGDCDDLDSTSYCAQDNPFGININVAGDCVLYSYDVSDDGVLDDSERFGFMKSGGELYIRLQGADHSCDLTKGTWAAMTISSGSERVVIDDFKLSDTASQCGKLTGSDTESGTCTDLTLTGTDFYEVRRHVMSITLQAHVGADSEIVKTTIANVTVANDAVIEH